MQSQIRTSDVLFCVISGTSAVLALSAFISTLQLPLLDQAGLLSWLVLVALTFAVSRFTVSVTGTDGLSQSRKSVADTFVFLAIMVYAIPPADTVGPATLLAAIVGFISTFGLSSRREVILTTAIAVISTFVSASCYGFLVEVFAGNTSVNLENGFQLNVFLVPVLALAVLQYFHQH
jgi:hypothetical protein